MIYLDPDVRKALEQYALVAETLTVTIKTTIKVLEESNES